VAIPGLRLLQWVHRWLGIAGCLLFAAWFLSGLVMMYVGFPSLTEAERWAGLSPLRLADATISPAAAMATLPATARAAPPRHIRLETMWTERGPEPVWRIVDAAGERHTVSAGDGRPLGPTSAAQAQVIAREFSRQAAAQWLETLERDQWTVPQGLNRLRPLHRIAIADAAGTELYVSSRSGEVVRDTTRHERFWNWLGAVPHWIYFTTLRAEPPLWHNVVVWVSGACIASAITGLVLGVVRLRLRRRRGITPYRGWMAWHHVAGLVGGIFVLTWIASGWLSMSPNGWFADDGVDAPALARFQGAMAPGDITWPAAAPAGTWREMSPLVFGGRPLLQWRDGAGTAIVTDAVTGKPARLTRADMAQSAGRMWPGVSVSQVLLLTQEDAHWYSHHDSRLLPVWRVVLDNAVWLHIDPASGQILDSSTPDSRLQRWLFNAAHTLDFPWLIHHRPAWDIVVWLLALGGLTTSVSGIVIGWRHLRRPSRKRRRSRIHPTIV